MNKQSIYLNEIKSIRSKLYDLNDCFEELNSSLKNSIIIDKKTIREDDVDSLKSSNNSVISEINSEIIPRIYNIQ